MRKLFNLICSFWRKFSRQQEEEVYLSNIRECVKISMKGACPDLDLLVHHYDEEPDKIYRDFKNYAEKYEMRWKMDNPGKEFLTVRHYKLNGIERTL